MKTITEKALLKRLERDGYNPERVQVFHGYYYDGIEHGENNAQEAIQAARLAIA